MSRNRVVVAGLGDSDLLQNHGIEDLFAAHLRSRTDILRCGQRLKLAAEAERLQMQLVARIEVEPAGLRNAGATDAVP